MTGVEILAMEEVVIDSCFNWLAFWIAFGVVFSIPIIIGILISVLFHDWSNIFIGAFLGIVFGCIFGVLFGHEAKIPTEYATQYKVVISDEVPMNEFMGKYEIIDQEGKIYTVREKD